MMIYQVDSQLSISMAYAAAARLRQRVIDEIPEVRSVSCGGFCLRQQAVSCWRATTTVLIVMLLMLLLMVVMTAVMIATNQLGSRWIPFTTAQVVDVSTHLEPFNAKEHARVQDGRIDRVRACVRAYMVGAKKHACRWSPASRVSKRRSQPTDCACSAQQQERTPAHNDAAE